MTLVTAWIIHTENLGRSYQLDQNKVKLHFFEEKNSTCYFKG